MEELTNRARLGSNGQEFQELIKALFEEQRREIYQAITSSNADQLVTLKARLINLDALESKLNLIIQSGKAAQDKLTKGDAK